MKKISWNRWLAAIGSLATGCVLYLITSWLVFFAAGLAAFFIILIAAFIG